MNSITFHILFLSSSCHGDHYKPVDCDDIVERQSGVYRIYPIDGIGFDVYCDWSTNNEGWTVRYYNLIDCCLTVWSNIPARTRL
jgi:hypothetical protein